MRRRSAPAKRFADERPYNYNDLTETVSRSSAHLPFGSSVLEDGLLSSPESQQIPSIACLVRISQDLQFSSPSRSFHDLRTSAKISI
jgi:hypothetical protein